MYTKIFLFITRKNCSICCKGLKNLCTIRKKLITHNLGNLNKQFDELVIMLSLHVEYWDSILSQVIFKNTNSILSNLVRSMEQA